MSTISNAQAFCGLTAVATPSKTGVSGSLTISGGTARVSLPEVTESYAFIIYISDNATATINILEADTNGSTAWVAGAAQVETATAVGTISTAGNASVVVTATGMGGTPKTIAVPVALGDTAAVWAEKVRVALAADADVSAMFTVDGTGTAIRLTRKPTHTIDTINFYAANITNLNIALDNGTCAGITTAATSSNTTAGTATGGALFVDADGNNFQGDDISMTAVQAICFDSVHGDIVLLDSEAGESVIKSGQKTVHMITSGDLDRYDGLEITQAGEPAAMIVTVQGVKST
jgi:hypothetical protein